MLRSAQDDTQRLVPAKQQLGNQRCTLYDSLMNQLDEKTVRHVAHLARIAITDAEARLYGEQLSKILDYVNQMNGLDTTNVPPTEHPLQAADVFRADVIHESWPPELALKNAPDRHGDFFRVPRVLDQEDA